MPALIKILKAGGWETNDKFYVCYKFSVSFILQYQYSRASSALSISGIRQQFSTEENIRLSSYSLEFLRNSGTLLKVAGDDAPDIQFVEQG